MVRRRPSMGRQKIEIKKIENEEARQVCFSKRRTGLFKKASELSILCGAELAVVVFSPAGKVFSFGHPSVEAVVDRFLGGPKQVGGAAGTGAAGSAPLQPGFKDLNRQYTELSNKLEAEKKKREAAEKALKGQQQQHYWRDVDIEEALGLEELEAFMASVEQLKCGVAKRAEKLLLEAAAASRRPLAPAPLPPAAVNLAPFAPGNDAFQHLGKENGGGGGGVFDCGGDALRLRRAMY